jgi:hypothetical protein
VRASGWIHAIQKQHVKVDVQVQRRAEALDQRHGPGRGAVAREAGLTDEIVRDGPVHHAEHLRECGRVRGQQEPQRVWQRQHPLSQRTFGQHLIGQRCGGLRHAPRTTRGTEPALLAAERDELLGVALLAAHAQEALLEPAARQAGLELLLHMTRQRPSGLGRRAGTEQAMRGADTASHSNRFPSSRNP